MSNNFYPCTCLTGGVGALSLISGSDLADGDAALVGGDGYGAFYQLDADSGLAESLPNIVSPVVNAGDKRWILISTSAPVVSGTQGVQGARGYQGYQGDAGPQGYQGEQGNQGYQGFQGVEGHQGYQGVPGNQGYQGDAGVNGYQGTQGATGNQGAQGVTGTVGSQGAAGADGAQGFQGNDGNQGFQGDQGVEGAQGSAGVTGAQGSQGNDGTGLTWQGAWVTGSSYVLGDAVTDAGTSYVCILAINPSNTAPASDTTHFSPIALAGAQGAQGATGSTGAQGPQGNVGSQGATGPQGNTGSQGLTGSTGSQGPQGLTGSQGVAGPQGDQGSQGAVGPQGVIGPQGLTGSQGTTGPQGATGSQGVTGPQGLRGPQGYVGSQGNIGPQGDPGPQGVTGATGNQGPTGSQGAQGVLGETFAGVVQFLTGGYFYGGSKSTYASTAAGWWLGDDGGTAKMNIGDSTNSLNWDGTQLNITGKITSSDIDGTNIKGSSFVTKGSYLTASVALAATTVYIADTTDFNASGTARIYDSVASKDDFTYTGKTSISLTGCSGVSAHTVSSTNKPIIVPANQCKLVALSAASNEMYYWGDRGDGTIEELVSIGKISAGGDVVCLQAGSSNLTSFSYAGYFKAFENYAIYAESNEFPGIYSISSGSQGLYSVTNASGKAGIKGVSLTYDGYGGYFDGVAGGITIRDSSTSGAPTHSAIRGTLWVNNAGVLYINTSGSTTWAKVGAQ